MIWLRLFIHSKAMILCNLKKILYFWLFYHFLNFLETAYWPIHIQFSYYFHFQKLEKDLENLFCSCQKINCVYLLKNWHNYCLDHCCSCNFEKMFLPFFVTLQSMTVPNFMSKTFSYQDSQNEMTLCLSPPSLCMIKQKYPGLTFLG